jgi:hypothetical protein
MCSIGCNFILQMCKQFEFWTLPTPFSVWVSHSGKWQNIFKLHCAVKRANQSQNELCKNNRNKTWWNNMSLSYVTYITPAFLTLFMPRFWAESYSFSFIECLMSFDMIYIFNRSWVDTQWQQYITHLHTNSTHNTERGKWYIERKIGSAGRAPSCELYPGMCLTTEKPQGSKWIVTRTITVGYYILGLCTKEYFYQHGSISEWLWWCGSPPPSVIVNVLLWTMNQTAVTRYTATKTFYSAIERQVM